jgi:GGDEF domain-containing protein
VATVTAIVFSPDGRPLSVPDAVDRWLASLDVPRVDARNAEELMSMALRARPRTVVVDVRGGGEGRDTALTTVRRLKEDSYTAVIPVVMLADDSIEALDRGFAAGADEVIPSTMTAAEATTRLRALMQRSDRDLNVHPSTRLPGAVEIEAEISRRMSAETLFATCYADLDHFKEFNDRYSYYDGDRVIRILAQILHDVVKGTCGERGFVGHIGGDDFIFIIPFSVIHEVCSEIVWVFDLLIPLQYSEQDRRAGYFFGKDRRGQLHRVPLMTVSIGIVTNERRVFTHPSQVSALATEMKSYAKTLPGSVFSIDRRADTTPARTSGAVRLDSLTAREES